MPVIAGAAAREVDNMLGQQAILDRNQNLACATIIGRDPNYNRKPDYWINLFNTQPVEHTRHRPLDFPTIKITACPKGQPWVLALRVGNIVNYKQPSTDTGEPVFSSITGERWATDLVNPANLGTNMWAGAYSSEVEQMHGGGDDLARRGVFWSVRRKALTPCDVCNDPERRSAKSTTFLPPTNYASRMSCWNGTIGNASRRPTSWLPTPRPSGKSALSIIGRRNTCT